mgnify:CR=1 FL=1
MSLAVLPKSKVFHKAECRYVKSATSFKIYNRYEKAADGRRPCKICHPVYLDQYEENHPAVTKRKTMTVYVVGYGRIKVRRETIIGCCNSQLHPGMLIQDVLEEHECLKKNCPHLRSEERRVEHPNSYFYRIFYVTDNQFNDWDQFPDFYDSLLEIYPRSKFHLQHIRDIDGHFVTIDEYYSRKR